MITIATFAIPEEAHLFRTFLEARGIQGFVLDENVVQLFWRYSSAIGLPLLLFGRRSNRTTPLE